MSTAIFLILSLTIERSEGKVILSLKVTTRSKALNVQSRPETHEALVTHGLHLLLLHLNTPTR